MGETTPHTAHPPVGHGGHETRDVTFRPIVRAGIGMLIVMLLIFLMMWGLFRYLAARQAELSPAPNPLNSQYGRQLPPEPRLQSAPIKDLHDLRAAEDAALNSYGWVDQKAGAARIPIVRAMELLAQRGLPSRPQAGGTDAR